MILFLLPHQTAATCTNVLRNATANAHVEEILFLGFNSFLFHIQINFHLFQTRTGRRCVKDYLKKQALLPKQYNNKNKPHKYKKKCFFYYSYYRRENIYIWEGERIYLKTAVVMISMIIWMWGTWSHGWSSQMEQFLMEKLWETN